MSRPPFVVPLVLSAVCLAGAFRPSMPAPRAPATPTATPRAARAMQTKPRLVVLITIDQFRADYLDRFGHQLTGGIARLARTGAHFTNAHHDHAITETAPGHATLLSGRFPRSTGIMMNAVGVDDEDAPLVAGGYGAGASPRRFQGTTLVDWMRAADGRTRALSVSMKDRGAILPIGRSKSDVYWYSIDGRFLTSTYYRKDLPAWVQHFNARQMVAQYAGRTWDLLLPDSAYTEKDSVAIEMAGRNVTFPHRLTDDVVDAGSAIRITPFMDDLVLDFALHGVTALGLGAGPQTDLLAVSLSATDVIGHNYGPDSREIHDQVLRVDRALGRFLDSLAVLRGPTALTVVLTADHGVGTIPELAPDSVQPRPRRVSLQQLVPTLRAQLRGDKVDTFALGLDVQTLLSNRRAFRKPAQLDSTVQGFAALARLVPGVARADRFAQLLGDTLTDEIARRWAHQFPAASNVELVFTLDPLSTWGGNVASHGSPYAYDSHVPLIFAGAGVTAGKHPQFVRTVDLAPTLASLLGVKALEPIDGVPLPVNR
ncbi:MAG: alkaline phosphatase family protein [Gemmatimonas sp.]|uniref:alkaline phosphatase family protein n=1 Tax=Gemmatimonas sp. TaxID=1962908 RepID=UPI00391FBD8C|nr:alkaline phosphatase family protein [Gemmatimonadota bacterium]